MKKILSLILTLAFVLCGVAALNVNAADIVINDWTIRRGGGFFVKTSGYEFKWKADKNGDTWDWPANHSGSLTEGSITATVCSEGNIAIYFGANKMSAVEDNVASVSSLVDLKYSLISFVYVSGTPKLRFSYDDKSEASAVPGAVSDVALTDAKYGIDGTSDVTIKVEFTAAGKVVAYVNGQQAIVKESGYPTAGSEFGMMVRGAKYGSEKANSNVGYVKSFSTSSAVSGASKWTVRRGGTSWQIAPSDSAEFLWKYVADSGNANNGRSYTNLLQYYKDLEEGTVTMTVAKNSRAGIAFAGSGFENVKEGSGNVSVSTAPNFKYYWAVVDWDSSAQTYYLALKADNLDTEGSQSTTTVSRVTLTDDISKADYTIKVEFTKTGDISVYFNSEKLIEVTGQTIYGDQLGVINANRGPLTDKVGQVAGTVNSFSISEDISEPDNGNQGNENQGGTAPETGDATSVYFVLSVALLCATFAVALVSRKKIKK